MHYGKDHPEGEPRPLHMNLGAFKNDSYHLDCLECGSTLLVKEGNFGGIGKHIGKHKELVDCCKRATTAETSLSGPDSEAKVQVKVQSSLTAHGFTLGGYEQDLKLRQQQFEERLARAIVLGLLPLSFIDNPYMKEVYEALDPHISVPVRRTLVDRLIPELRKKIETLYVLPALKLAEVVHFSFDLWMKQMQAGFPLISGCLWFDDFVYRHGSRLLGSGAFVGMAHHRLLCGLIERRKHPRFCPRRPVGSLSGTTCDAGRTNQGQNCVVHLGRWQKYEVFGG